MLASLIGLINRAYFNENLIKARALQTTVKKQGSGKFKAIGVSKIRAITCNNDLALSRGALNVAEPVASA